MRTYQGSCHCGAAWFSFRSEPLTTDCRCNCSICRRHGYVMSSRYYARAELESLQGLEALSVYRFGDRMVNHYFCPTCGVSPFHDTTVKPGEYRVNLGCVEDVDLDALEIALLDGKSF